MKDTRQSLILQIINENEIETQSQLMQALLERGVQSTQATLSRDIKQLHLIKELSESGRYHYVVSSKSKNSDRDARLRKIFKECVTSYETAQNIIVIKTLPGLANGACSMLDTMDIDTLVGSLAGDDTAFLAMKDNEAAEALCREIDDMF